MTYKIGEIFLWSVPWIGVAKLKFLVEMERPSSHMGYMVCLIHRPITPDSRHEEFIVKYKRPHYAHKSELTKLSETEQLLYLLNREGSHDGD